jgi:hypothetical protein
MKLTNFLSCWVGVAAGLFILTGAVAAPVTIPTGATIWNDTAGNQINAHGGCVLQVGDTFYWYGENHLRAGRSVGINCYVSTNLVDWTFKHQVLSQGTPGLADSQFERPKVIYNAATKKYVLWAHRENLRGYADAQAAVAQCDRPDGDFALVKLFRPFDQTDVMDHGRPGFMSRDCNLFKDDDGTAWFVSSSNENTDMMLYKLSPDYLDAVEHYNVLPGARREAPALFKFNGKYYLITSAATGWNANYNTLQEADHITGPYGPQQGLISRLGDSTFNSQANFVLPVAGSQGTTLIFMSDRWKSWNLPNSRNIWLPLRFDHGQFQPIAWGDHWQLDLATGLATFPLDPVPGPGNLARHKPVTCDKNNQENGKEPKRIVDGSTRTGWAAETGDAPQWLMVDLGQPSKLNASKITWEGNQRAYQYFIEASLDGVTWTNVVDHRGNAGLSETNDDPLDCTGRYFRLTITGKGVGMYFWATCEEWELLSGTTNVALNKPVEASSAEWGRYAAKIADGDFGTYWPTGDGLPGHWARIDLGESQELTACRLFWQNPGYYYQYKIEVSPDGTNWVQVVDMTTNTVATRLPVHQFQARGQYVKLTLTGADDGCWPALAEFEVFAGGPVPTGEPYTPFRSSSGVVTGR